MLCRWCASLACVEILFCLVGFLYWNNVLCSLGRPQTCCMAKDYWSSSFCLWSVEITGKGLHARTLWSTLMTTSCSRWHWASLCEDGEIRLTEVSWLAQGPAASLESVLCPGASDSQAAAAAATSCCWSFIHHHCHFSLSSRPFRAGPHEVLCAYLLAHLHIHSQHME